VQIQEVGPTGAARIADLAALAALTRAADAPGGQPIIESSYAATIRHPVTGYETRNYAATADGALVGYLRTEVKDTDPRRVTGQLLVHPAHRRRGHGTALLDFALDRCRAEGRDTLALSTITAVEGGPARDDAGARFLERHGFAVALNLIRRRVPVAPAESEPGLWDEALAASADYELRGWTGPVPDELLIPMCRMDSMVLREVPMGGLGMAPEQVDTARLRAKEAATAAHRKTGINTVAVHKGTGDVAAHTRVDVYDDPAAAHGHVLITIVDPAHRGHRLGLLVKLANLRQLREEFPQVAELWTANADVNAPMIAINERLGYRPVEHTPIYQRRIDR
jgi:GNAT superfamily N-acetyltransferase